MGKNTGVIIILSIISLTGLGLGGYTFITTVVSPQVVGNQGIILVGLWDELYVNMDYSPYDSTDYWLLEYGSNKMNDSNYISISNTNTRITLLKSGWYRLHISMVLKSIDALGYYWIRLYKNSALEGSMDFHETSANPESSFHVIDSSAFVYSNGTDYFEFVGYAIGDTDFSLDLNALNQLTIENLV